MATAAGAVGWQLTGVGYGAIVAAAGPILLLVPCRYSPGQFGPSVTSGTEQASCLEMKAAAAVGHHRRLFLLSEVRRPMLNSVFSRRKVVSAIASCKGSTSRFRWESSKHQNGNVAWCHAGH